VAKKRVTRRPLAEQTGAGGRKIGGGKTAKATPATHLKAMQKQLAEREAMYRNLLGNISEAVFEVDENGVVRFISPAIEHFVGYSPSEVCGRHFMQFIYPDDRELLLEQFQMVSRSILEPTEYRLIDRNGDLRWIVSSSRPIFRSGVFRGLNGVMTDIHERKIAQEALKKQQELLQQAQKMEAIGTLAAGIAHDFNNLLMGIQGRTSLLLMEEGISPSCLEHLTGIEQCVRSAARLTQQLLGLARGGKYEVAPTDLNALIQEGIEIFGRTKKEIQIVSVLDPGLSVVEIDRTQIAQVLLNLLVNAWQAMPGGGEIAVRTGNVDIAGNDALAMHLPAGRFVRLTVSDGGIGMDAHTRCRVFDPFFTTKDLGHGSGLGLASAYGIVKNHGGTITVNSEPGRGSTFDVYLPACEKAVEKKKEAVPPLPRGGETVLLIDDEEMILDVGEQMLLNLGYRVLKARGGVAALEVFRRHHARIQLVVLDMIMPQMSGSQVFEDLKAIDPGVRVLLSSGYSLDGQARDILARGCRGFIQKPFTVRDMALKVREVLEA
jgi:PAS domain S-box-containing protein